MAAHGMNSVTVFGPRARVEKSGEPAESCRKMMELIDKSGLTHEGIPTPFGLGDLYNPLPRIAPHDYGKIRNRTIGFVEQLREGN